MTPDPSDHPPASSDDPAALPDDPAALPDDPAASPAHPADRKPDKGSVSRARAAERRRLAEIFGDVLPDSTSDDLDEPREARSTSTRDDELRRDVPPHHPG